MVVSVALRNGRRLYLGVPEAWAITKLFEAGIEVLDLRDDVISLKYRGRDVHIHGFMHGDVVGAFTDYHWLSVEGRRVLDVGASIGDTAIYFSLRGAMEVVAFEPYPF
ncbi:MAG: hypothetical protein ACP5G6_09135, partial [Conexivisphaera sp.]